MGKKIGYAVNLCTRCYKIVHEAGKNSATLYQMYRQISISWFIFDGGMSLKHHLYLVARNSQSDFNHKGTALAKFMLCIFKRILHSIFSSPNPVEKMK